MKRISLLVLSIASVMVCEAQSNSIDGIVYPYPPTSAVAGETYWCGAPISKTVQRAELIFEGRILSDSVRKNDTDDDVVAIDYCVLVLKQFKGTFTSDTIIVQNDMYGWKKGDEALFCLYSYGNTFHALHGPGCGFVGVCNRTDIKEKIYDPLQEALGKPYVEVHPNMCATK